MRHTYLFTVIVGLVCLTSGTAREHRGAGAGGTAHQGVHVGTRGTRPGSLHYTDEPIRALDRCLVALPLEEYDLGAVRNGFRSRAFRQTISAPASGIKYRSGACSDNRIRCVCLFRLRLHDQTQQGGRCENG